MGVTPLKHSTDSGNHARSAWEQFDGELHRYLMRRLGHAQDVQDLAQEVYIRLIRFKEKEAVRNFRAYVYKIASHVVYEFKFRGKEQFVTIDSEAVEAYGENPPHVIQDQLEEGLSLQQELEQKLNELHPTCRAVLILYKRDGLSYEEVAKELDISVHTVKKYIARSLSILRRAKWNEGME